MEEGKQIPDDAKGLQALAKTEKGKDRQRSFKARMAKHIAKGKMSAAYWANKVKW